MDQAIVDGYEAFIEFENLKVRRHPAIVVWMISPNSDVEEPLELAVLVEDTYVADANFKTVCGFGHPDWQAMLV